MNSISAAAGTAVTGTDSTWEKYTKKDVLSSKYQCRQMRYVICGHGIFIQQIAEYQKVKDENRFQRMSGLRAVRRSVPRRSDSTA